MPGEPKAAPRGRRMRNVGDIQAVASQWRTLGAR